MVLLFSSLSQTSLVSKKGYKMKYSPKKFDTAVRVIYSACLVFSFVFMMIKPGGMIGSILPSLALILLAASLYLFIKYDCTSYEYILIERNGTLDFYVNKISGKRGTYICYYPLSDCIEIKPFAASTKEEIRKRYKNSRFSKYVQNFISSKELYYALFQNDGFYDCVIFEPNGDFIKLMLDYVGKAPIITLHNPEDEDAEITAVDVSDDEGSES